MRQLLVFGFYCEIYRREPRCRIYINDVLLDEFDIPHTPRIDLRTADMMLDPADWGREQFHLESNPPFLKYLELDNAGESLMNIRIEIQNNDNNYANGFMTRYTRVMTRYCCVAPVKAWEEFEQLLDRWKFSKRNWHKWQNNTNYIIQHYSKSRSYVFDNLMRFAGMHFPGLEQQPLINQPIKDSIYNHQYPNDPSNPCEQWIGSSGYYSLTLVKKLGFWRHSTDRRRGFWWLSIIKNISNLYNKYKQYEDTGSINQ